MVPVAPTAFALFLRFPTTRREGHHQLGIAIDDDIRIVRDHNDLPMAFDRPQLGHDQIVDQVVVQIVLRLV